MSDDNGSATAIGDYLVVTDIRTQQPIADDVRYLRERKVQLRNQPEISDVIPNENARWHVDAITISKESYVPVNELGEPRTQTAVKLTFLDAYKSPERLEYLCRMCRDIYTDRATGECPVNVEITSGFGVDASNVTIWPKPGTDVNVLATERMNNLLVELEAASLISRPAAEAAAPMLGVKKQTFMDLSWRAVFKDEKSGGHYNYLDRNLSGLREQQRKCTFTVEYGLTEAPVAAQPKGLMDRATEGGRGPLSGDSLAARRAMAANITEIGG